MDLMPLVIAIVVAAIAGVFTVVVAKINGKLNVIHVLVNSRLHEALDEIKALKALLESDNAVQS